MDYSGSSRRAGAGRDAYHSDVGAQMGYRPRFSFSLMIRDARQHKYKGISDDKKPAEETV